MKNMTRPSQVFQIYNILGQDKAKTSGKINKWTSPRPRLINTQNWSETETRPRVSVPLVSKPRRDRESRHPLQKPASVHLYCRTWAKRPSGKDKTLGLVSVSRLKAPRLSVSINFLLSLSRTCLRPGPVRNYRKS